MDNQDAFNRVWTHFVVNERPPSINDMGESCLYRGTGGAQCAFGIMIPDGLYDPEMEDTGIGSILKDYPAVAKLVEGVSLPLLNALQGAHDNAAVAGGDKVTFFDSDVDGTDWRIPAVAGGFHTKVRAYLTAVADRHNLRVPAEPTRFAV